MKALIAAVALAAGIGRASPPLAGETPWAAVDAALGREGKDLPGEVRKYGFPRLDLHVTAGGVAIEPALALGSWAAFRSPGTGSMMMGDLVLLPVELNPVIRRLHAGGVEIGAIHNHLTGELPPVVYVHFSAMGEAPALARALRTALELTRTPLGAPGASAALSADELKQFDALQAALGRKGTMAGRVLQVGVPRQERIEEGGMEIQPAMGMAIALNFQIAGTQMATTGDFVLSADEVNPVVRELQAHGIDVTALHSHMLRETPRLFFLHFWGVASPEKLGAGLKAGLAKVATKP
ncbi:MAG: DUF1259 domain-containing protein [Thermoanaerobaculia bacterium]